MQYGTRTDGSTATVTQNNNTVAIAGVVGTLSSLVPAGSLFTVTGSGVPYVVGSVSGNNIILTSNYAGANGAGLSFAVTTSFTPVLGIPYMEGRDVETSTTFKRAMFRIEQELTGGGTTLEMPDGTVGDPGLHFASEPTTGFYRPGAGQLGFSILGTAIARLIVSGLVVLTASFVAPASGEGKLFGTAANGLNLTGFGSTYDVALLNRAGAVALGVTANTQNLVASGNINVNNSTDSVFRVTSAVSSLAVDSSITGNVYGGALRSLGSANIGIGIYTKFNSTFVQSAFFNTGATNNTPGITLIGAADPANNVINVYLGSGDTTSLTADQWAAGVRFNGAGVQYGDITFHPSGGDNGEKGHFRFAVSGGVMDGTPDANVAVGKLIAGNVVWNGTAVVQAQGSTQGIFSFNSTNASGGYVEMFRSGAAALYVGHYAAASGGGVTISADAMFLRSAQGVGIGGNGASVALYTDTSNDTHVQGQFLFGNDLVLARDAANTLSQRNGTNGQILRIYKTFTDASNYGRLAFFNTGGVYTITTQTAGTEAGLSGDMLIGPTPVNTQLQFQTAGINRWLIALTGHLTANTDNTLDIGASGATRPRNGYFGTSVFTPLVGTNGATNLTLTTSGGTQVVVAHVASAVNYVQLKGSTTGVGPWIEAAGSDTAISMRYSAKGAAGHIFYGDAGGNVIGFISHSGGTPANYIEMLSATATNSPHVKASGSDTNIDLAWTPKGTGVVKFGTHSAIGAETVTGYITVKDSGGTSRKLAVVS